MKKDFSLKNYNTFGIEAKTRYFASITEANQLKKALQFAKDNQHPIFILGGGSNIVFTRDFQGVVVAMQTKGITEEIIDDNHVMVTAKAGENWHQFVQYCLSKNYGGIENLALIPGNVGTSPIQNIGAYGVEIKDTMQSCTVLNVSDFTIKKLSRDECRFGYRDSIFKKEAKGKYIVLEVSFLLTRKNHKISVSYGAIQQELDKEGITQPNIQQVAKAVVAIRRSKLPDPAVTGNCGSFFKNPIISTAAFTELSGQFPQVPHYSSEQGVKVPAGWLIEKTGWKGKIIGNVGCHPQQALVIINATGKASGQEVFEFSEQIINSVHDKFKISLEREVNIL